jgi:NAD(P)-dependent dehydrogenase (short-subunit alcohol dehydrogenase family)
MSDFKDRVTIITGAGTGIGRDMAISFAGAGARVAITGRRRDPLEETADLAAREGQRPLVLPADMSVEGQVDNFVERVVEALGPVDFLISNAAEPGKDLYIQEETLDNWNACIGTNMTAAMLLSRACLKHMLPRRSGVILTLSSGAALEPMERKSHYSATKMGLIAFTRCVAGEAGPHGIRANCIVVGPTYTDLAKRYYERIAAERGVDVQTVLDESNQRLALRRQVQPHEITSTAMFLCSDGAGAITGQAIRVDAGWAMY